MFLLLAAYPANVRNGHLVPHVQFSAEINVNLFLRIVVEGRTFWIDKSQILAGYYFVHSTRHLI